MYGHDVGGHDVELCEVNGEDLSRHLNKLASVSVREAYSVSARKRYQTKTT